MTEKTASLESVSYTNSTNGSFSESFIQDINLLKSKNVMIISKNFEQKIPDLLSYIQNNSNLAINKISIIKYLQNLFLTININSEIFLRKLSSEKEKLNLYQIIIEQYISYTNSANFPTDESDYRKELLNLFGILLSQVTINRESYHYILTFLLKYINEKNNHFNLKENEQEENDDFHLTAEHLSRILMLLQKFYQFLDQNILSLNYFFFSADSDSCITIQNKNSPKDNKKLLGLEDNLCILMFIKVFPSEYIKTIYNNTEFNILELKLNDKNKNISINIDMENNLTTNFTDGGLAKLLENDTNWLLIKFKRKKRIKVKMYLNGKKIRYKKEKDKEKDKEEIKEILLFKNFIGICYNFLIFKTKKKEIFPKFLENEIKRNNIENRTAIKQEDKSKKILLPENRTNYYNGFINEELSFPFIKNELKDEIEPNILNHLFQDKNNYINKDDIKDFVEKLISIYMPTRVIIPPSCNNYTINNTPQLILEDSVNGLDAEFSTKNPSLNGVHIYKRMIDDFGPIGGLNNLLPILEIMTQHQELLNKDNLGNFFDILISVFVPQYQKALIKEKNSNFFLYLSYFFEKIPKNLYDSSLIGIFKSISSFLTTQINENNDFIEFTQQFHNNILMNENILFKFNQQEQREIIDIITNVIKNIDKDKKPLNIDIIKIINILLHLDKDKNYLFCCKKHAEYFTVENDIMNPELYIRLQPIKELLNHLFTEFEEKVNKNDSSAEESGKMLGKLFTLLTYDVSPCIQKMIIKIFYNFLSEHFNNFFSLLDKEEQILNIALFILKTSIFEIKEDIINLIFIILKYENNNSSKEIASINENKCEFISNYILPFYLFEDKELLQRTSVENNEALLDNINNNININKIKNNFKIKENDNTDHINKAPVENKPKKSYSQKLVNQILKDDDTIRLKNEFSTNAKDVTLIEDYFEDDNNVEENLKINYNLRKQSSKEQDIYDEIYGEDDLNNSKSKLNGIKLTTIINNVKYNIPILSQNMTKLHSIYNKKKLYLLINNLYNTIYKYFHEGILIRLSLNLLTKIVAKGDLFLVSTFLNNIKSETTSNQSEENNKEKLEEIYDNQNLLQWLIETCFQATLAENSKLDHTIFVPGFNINVSKVESDGLERQLTNEEKLNIIKEIIKNSKALLTNIFKKNIYKMDYIFTWSKYFYELRNETNNFKSVRNLILEFMVDIGYNTLKDCRNPDINNNLEQKMTIYFFNLLFEFVTFYKLKQSDLDEYHEESSIYQELSTNLKYILISKMDDCRDSLRPIDVQENIDSKFEEYPIFKTTFDFWTPLWKSENKPQRQENDIYKTYINNKKNVNINELELLFYNFCDIKEFKDDATKNIYVNKGIPLIYILYHFFTLIFSIGGNEVELRELFTEFRLFLLLLIISSSTLSTPGIAITKKKKWPSDEQYKNVQQTTEAIIFNFLYFLINKIKDTSGKINGFNEREQNLDESEQKYLNYLNQINKILIENLGYFLKVLNRIYREIKKEDEKNNGGFGVVGGFFKGIKYLFFEYEGVKKSGGFKLFEKMYSECSNLTDSNYLDQITELNFNNKDFLINSKSKASTKETEKNESFLKLEKYINLFMGDEQIEQFFENHSQEYKKLLFPFVSFISLRRDAVKNIIPVYDNRPNITFYPKEFCLIPEYFPENSFDDTLTNTIDSINKVLNTDLQLNQKKSQIDLQYKSHNYKKEKEKLFSFTGIWSIKDFFYNKKKYKLKYRLLNHMSDDYTRVLLTPIIDVDYYLPYFSKFNPINLFRNTTEYKSVCKIADLSFDIKKPPPPVIPEKKDKKNKDKETKDNKDNNTPLKMPEPKPVNEIIDEEKLDNEIKIKDENEDKEKNALYYIGIENFNFLNDKEKRDETNIHEHLFLSFIQEKHCSEKDKYFTQANACYVKLAFHIRGIIFINIKGIGFYSFESKRNGDEEDYDSDRKVCFGSVFRPQICKYKDFFMTIPYHKIQLILKRRYYFKKTALEIFTEDRKSYLFRIDENKIKFFIESIKFYMKQDLDDIYIEYNKFEEKIGFVNKKNIFLNTNQHFLTNEKKFMNLKTMYEKWSKWEISTMKMIMIMNIYSNRSYNDINQYPVFPWITTDYTSKNFPNFEKEHFIRPMNKPMGMMDFTDESRERKENYEEHWQSNEADEDREDNYDRYGSHYSTSLYLTYYLVRVFPYSYIRIELQGKNFDDPNRLFNSLPNSFDCAITQKSDLRELIPEFFCFPEMFLNMNELNLGEVNDESGHPKLVGGVEMPLWSNYNEYNFIEKHRALLESAEINEKINEWFNIIFGSKQKGKEAKKIGNLFIKQTYEDFEETYNKSSKSEKVYQCRMVEFGVTPNQLFKYDTYKRQNLNDCGKIKRSLLFNILQKRNKNIELSGKEWDLDEMKVNIEDYIHKMFIFIVKKKDKKKERLYLLSNNKVKIYTKYDRSQFFKSTIKENDKQKGKDKEKSKDKEKDKDKDKDKDEEKDENKDNENDNDIDDMNIGDVLVEEYEENDKDNEIKRINSSYTSTNEKSEMKMGGKEQSKVNIYPKYDKKFSFPKYRMKFTESPNVLYDEGFHIALGGFWNGDIILRQLIEFKTDSKKCKNKKINIIKTNDLSPITKILIDKTDTIAICCNNDGIIYIYIIDQNDKLVWNFYKIINEGQGEICSMTINENLNIFIICYKNGFCMVYTLPNCKLFNSFRIEQADLYNKKIVNKDNNDPNIDEDTINTLNTSNTNEIYCPDLTFISSSPLPCYVFYIKKRKSLVIYSINAKFLNEYYLGYEIVENGIKKYTDHFFRDYLFIFNSLNNTIDVHRLTDLNLVISSPVINHQFIDFQFTKDLDIAFILVRVKKNNDEKTQVNKMLILKQTPVEK